MKKYIYLLTFILVLSSCKKLNDEPSDPEIIPGLKIETILTGYDIIWGMDFLPDGSLVFGEKRGTLHIRKDGSVTEITGFPQVNPKNQGGLLDVRVHPDYALNGWIYACYTEAKLENGLKLIRFRISGNQVSDIETVFATNSPDSWNGHYGSRIVFDRNKFLYLSVGEGGSGSYGGPSSYNMNALDPVSAWGKVHRMRDNGTIPPDNPVLPGNAGPTTVYSYGHRNPQGLAMHPGTGKIWETEHGPMGGDEINIITPGSNYGWPLYSVGKNYDGTVISASHEAHGITVPLYTWTPSIGISGMTFITGEKFRSWKGNLLVSGLASQKLYRCVITDDKVTEESVLLTGYGRVRNVVQGPDGTIYVSVEGPGRIINIIPE